MEGYLQKILQLSSKDIWNGPDLLRKPTAYPFDAEVRYNDDFTLSLSKVVASLRYIVMIIAIHSRFRLARYIVGAHNILPNLGLFTVKTKASQHREKLKTAYRATENLLPRPKRQSD